MGACLIDANSRDINNKLREYEEFDNKLIKLLFLGPGGSGKSTIFKQLQWLHGGGYSENDRKLLIGHIHCQIIVQMKECIKYYLLSSSSNELQLQSQSSISETLSSEYDIKEDKLQEAINTVIQYQEINILSKEIADCIKFIWQNDNRLKDIFKVYHKTKILDETTEYFWNDIDRICCHDYIPNKEDIVNVRYRTIGIVQKIFEFQSDKYHIFDVGGQKSERKKWINCFDNVKAVIFVASLSCYNEFMKEDINTNSMLDTLQLFKKTINDQHFKETPFILFLNKRDLFENKIKNVPITICPGFDDFDINTMNPNNYQDTIKYIKSEFEAQCDDKNTNIDIHITCAMDQQNIKNVFYDVTKIIANDLLKMYGIK